MRSLYVKTGLALTALVLTTAMASAQQGPVAAACGDEIAKYCSDKQHVRGEVRACLEANKDKVSAACKTALDTTGPGKGQGQGQGPPR